MHRHTNSMINLTSRNETKSNRSNTLKKFFNQNEEMVESLNYFNPLQVSNSLIFNLKNNRDRENKKNPTSSKNLILPNISDNIQIHQKIELHDEISLENKRNQLVSKLEHQNNLKSGLKEKKHNIEREIEHLISNIDFLENHEKFFNSEFEYKKSLEIAKNEEKLKNTYRSPHNIKQTKSSDLNAQELVHTRLLQAHEDRLLKKENYQMKLELLKKEKDLIIQSLKSYSETSKKLKKEISIITQHLVTHYHYLLKEGVDTRNEGLVWIIDSIWNLGHEVIKSYLPDFLDEGAIIFLFSYAETNFEKKNIRNILEKLKEDYNNNNSGVEHTIFKTLDRYHRIKHEGVRQFRKELRSELSINLKTIKQIIDHRENIHPKMVYFVERIKELDAQFTKIKEEFEKIKEKELSRINMEFMMRDYEKRYQVSQKKVISALIGKENANIEYSKQLREQKEVWKKLKSCQTFNFIEAKEKTKFFTLPNIQMKLKIKKKKIKDVLLKKDLNEDTEEPQELEKTDSDLKE